VAPDPPTRRRAARLTRVAAVALAAVVLLAAPAPPPGLAGGDLRVEAVATYTLGADDTAVRVAVDFALTNMRPDSLSNGTVTSFFFDTFRMGLPAEAADVRASAAGSPLSVIPATVDPPDGVGPPLLTAVIALPERLHYQQTQLITVEFDLPGGPPRSDSRVRVNSAYASFDARAWGNPGLAGVEIVIDGSFDVTTFGAEVVSMPGDGISVFRADAITDPGMWLVHVSARRDAGLAEAAASVDGIAASILAWPDDAEWASRVTAIVEVGLPHLRHLIGLDYPPVEEVTILQARDPSLLGFGGWYLTDQDRIELGEHLDDHLVLHELTHLWFNQRLFGERWINEGLAEVYAAMAVKHLASGADPVTPEPPDSADPVAVPLNEWVFPDIAPSQDETVRLTEAYGYNASFWVMQAIVDDVGAAGMREVIGAADRREAAYVVDGWPAEQAEDPRTDWRRLLDLLDERGAASSTDVVFRLHVVTSDQADLLDERADARSTYLEVTDHAFAAPWAVRRRLEAWDFAAADTAMTAARAVLFTATEIEGMVTALDLRAPRSVQRHYESASTLDDLARAADNAGTHLTALTRIVEAQAVIDEPRGVLARIGLIGSDVNRRMVAARAAFDAEDPERATAEASAVIDLVSGANDAGRLRVFWAGGGALVLLGITFTWVVVARRRARHPGR
jgi:hypothetical protein